MRWGILSTANINAKLIAGARDAGVELVAVLGVWSIVQAIVFEGSNLEWFSFATAAALAGLATIGLIIHENSAERIVHELTVAPERATTPLAH